MKKRFLSILLALAMLLTCIPGGLLAEEEAAPEETVVETVVEEPAEEPTEEEPAEEPTEEEPAEEPTEEEPAEEPTEEEPAEEPTEEEPAEEPTEESDEEPVTEEPAEETVEEEAAEEAAVEEAAEAAFRTGLAALSAGDVYADANLTEAAGTVNAAAVVYVVARVTGEGEVSGNDVIKVAANVDGSVGAYYVKAARLTWMTEAEVSAYSGADHADGAAYLDTVLEPVDFTAAAVEEEPAEEESAEEEPAEEEPAEEEPAVEEPAAEEGAEEEEPAAEEEAEEEAVEEEAAEASAVVIVAQPVNSETEVGGTATFTVNATGVASYQWQYSRDRSSFAAASGTGNKTATMTLSATAARYALYYRCQLTDANGVKVYTNIVQIVEPAEPTIVIVDQPVDSETAVGGTATFTVNATGVESYQWQYSRDQKNYSAAGGTGNTTATMSIQATSGRYALYYRCQLTDADGNQVYTDVVQIVEPQEVFEITEQPVNAEVAIGGTATFTVVATGVASYQWQYSRDNSTFYSAKGEGNTTASMSLSVENARYALYYRCQLTGTSGDKIYTDVVRIVKPVAAVEITEQPVDAEVAIGGTATFTVVATGVASYQWQYSRDNSTFYSAKGEGNTTASMSLAVENARYALYYRCQLIGENGDKVYTDVVRIVKPVAAVEITEQPVDAEVAIGGTATFTVVATGVASYQWQYSRDNSTFYSAKGDGNTTASMSLAVENARYALYYRCQLTGENGDKVYTDVVRIVKPVVQVVITEQPVDAEAAVGENAIFTVVATGVSSYQWQYSKNNTNWYAAGGTGNKTASMTLQATSARYSYYYRCQLTGASGEPVYTDVVQIVVPFKIVTQPVDAEAAPGDTVSFTVVAIGAKTYQWQFSRDGQTYSAASGTGNTTATMSVQANASRYTFTYRCVITNEAGEELITDPVRILIVVDDVHYDILTSTTLTVVSYSGSASSLTIPQTVNGKTVTEIGESAFEGNTTLQSIDLPDSITVIRKRAFANCTNLSSMN